MEKQVAAVTALERGRREDALRLAKDAVDIELTLSAPSGPPEPIKPALELYGELLLAAERPGEAADAFEQALLRTPKRTPSLLGLARAASAAGDVALAKEAYGEIAAMEGAAKTSPAVVEARKYLDARR
jgi:predicted Zn-dependent protease